MYNQETIKAPKVEENGMDDREENPAFTVGDTKTL